MPTLRRFLIGAALLAAIPAAAQQPLDAEYTAKIRELTPTDPKWKFTTELVDHLPASTTVPTPLKVLGYVPGTIGRLSKTEDINRYFRAVAAASPRVRVFSLGMSEEGREMIVAAVADENTIKRLDDYREMTAKLADPRGEPTAEREKLIREAKPIYWLTGTIHAPETGSPEMLMELLYRLAVEESPYIQEIRGHVITLITPVTEVDGRNRIIDIINEEKQLKLGNGGIPTIYWGHYIAHDNNRDGLMMSIKLTQNMNSAFLHWHPQVMHDLHESVPFLYTSTGTGPYNDEFDPIVVDEWHTLAYQEITELTKRGLPGVWTHGFYDGWAPNYMLGIAQFRNSLGKFYETYTSGGADCQIVNLPAASTSREWDRPNPPVNGVKWCIRSNINYQQSGVLVALHYVAQNHETFMENFALKALRMVERGRTSPPYAFVIPREQRHSAEAADLINYFRKVGSEVQVASADFAAHDMPAVIERGAIGGGTGPAANGAAGRRGGGGGAGAGASRGAAAGDSATRSTVTVHAGDWIVRMDQPYTALVRTVLAVQRFRPDDPTPYDDTGWSLDQLRHVTVYTIADSAVLAKPMQPLKSDAAVAGRVAGSGAVLAVPHLGDWRSATLPWKLAGTAVQVADSAFSANGAAYAAGTFLVGDTPAARQAIEKLGMKATALASSPTVKSHPVQLPRIAFIHTWIETQNEGWVRHALEEMAVPFTYMSDQKLAEPGLLDRYDVVIFPHVNGQPAAIVNGRPMVGPPVPWRKTALTPDIGVIDSTSDIRPGLGLDGLAALRRFVERGGLLITEGNSSRLPVEFGFNTTVSVAATPRLMARGAVYRAQAVDRTSPILYGYDQASVPVYFNIAPLFTVSTGAPGGRGGSTNAADAARSMSVAQNRPDPSLARELAAQRARVILRFVTNADSLLVSGLLDNGSEMAGKAAVVDAPVGRGHVVLFGIRPMWRYETQGSYALVLNAMANWNALGVNEKGAAATEAER